MKRVCIALALLVTLLGVDTTAAQRLVWLGTLAGGYSSEATAGSADGQFVVGNAVVPDSIYGYSVRAVRWNLQRNPTASNIVEILEVGDGAVASRATGISADGSVVIGTVVYSEDRYHAAYWETGRPEPKLLERNSFATDVTSDGRFVVGWIENENGNRRPFLWDAMLGVIQDLGTLGGARGEARDISGNRRMAPGC